MYVERRLVLVRVRIGVRVRVSGGLGRLNCGVEDHSSVDQQSN